MTFAGVHTAIVTPFKNDEIDVSALRALIDRQFEGGVSGVVPAGTTGESPTLSHPEHEELVALTIEAAAGRGLVIAGTGSNSTREAVRLTQAAEKAGASASLQVCPYYNKPSQEGLYQHFKAIASETELPLMLYSIPGRCVVEIAVDTIARLAEECPNVTAVKEAGGNVERISQIRAAAPDGFEILSGDDSLTMPFMLSGASGLVSVASNLIPEVMTGLVKAGLDGDWATAQKIHDRYYPLFSAFLKTAVNPVPIKTALGMAGFIEPGLRLPLVEMEEEPQAELEAALIELDLLS